MRVVALDIAWRYFFATRGAAALRDACAPDS
jgi:hypothetical protein